MKDKLSGSFGIAFKLFLVLLVLVLVLTSVTTFFIYESSETALREETRGHLVDLAKTTALMVDVDKHSQLESGDEDTENYKEIRAALQSVMAANPMTDDIYTMVRSEEENIWLFVVDAYESKHIGDELAATSLFYNPLMESTLEHPVAEEKISEWGSFTAYAPIYDSKGASVAILGVDVCVEEEVEDFREFQGYWLDLVKSTARGIDGDTHSQLKIGDENSDNYREIQTILESVVDENTEIEDIYTMIKSEEGAWFYMVDVYAMTPGIGEEYDISEYPQMQLAFERPIADEEITIDKWGVWLSAYAPIYDEEGTAVAILGMDMDAGNVLAAEKKLKSIIALIFLGALLLSLIVSFTFSSHFTRPLKKLKFGTSRVIKGDLSHRIDIERKDEFGELAAAFNHMTASLQEHIEKLEQSKKKVEEAYQLRENFLKETSHRIITPVSIIGGYSEILLESRNLDEDQKARIRTIRERNEEVQKLVKDALEGNYLEEEEGDG